MPHRKEQEWTVARVVRRIARAAGWLGAIRILTPSPATLLVRRSQVKDGCRGSGRLGGGGASFHPNLRPLPREAAGGQAKRLIARGLATGAFIFVAAADEESAVAAAPTEPAAEAAVAPAEPKPDDEAVMAALEKRMAGIRSVRANFVQEKTLAILERPVTIEGSMALEDERLAWHVHAPVKYSVVVTGDTMRQWDEDTGRVRRESLKGNPVFGAVMEQLGHWFSGRYRALRKDYAVEILEREPAVRLRFAPREESVAAQAIQRVTVTFQADGDYIQSIEIVDRSGDTTLLTFSDTAVNEPVPPETWRVGVRR